MSHVADCDVKFRDMDAINIAVKRLGGKFMKDQKTHQWFGRFLNDWNNDRAAVNRRDSSTFGKCDHAIKFPDINYEIGMVREPDGSYTAIYDTYGGSGTHDGKKLEAACGGVGLPKLKDEYAAAVTTRMLARKGFRVQRSEAKGKITLKASRN